MNGGYKNIESSHSKYVLSNEIEPTKDESYEIKEINKTKIEHTPYVSKATSKKLNFDIELPAFPPAYEEPKTISNFVEAPKIISNIVEQEKSTFSAEKFNELFNEKDQIETHLFIKDENDDDFTFEDGNDGSLFLNLNIEELPLPYYETYHTKKAKTKQKTIKEINQTQNNDELIKSSIVTRGELSSLFPYYDDLIKDMVFENKNSVIDNMDIIEEQVVKKPQISVEQTKVELHNDLHDMKLDFDEDFEDHLLLPYDYIMY